jgi:NAD(P)-dependent dehydrogenase (short-subunit alcohol dehydrogenase family)
MITDPQFFPIDEPPFFDPPEKREMPLLDLFMLNGKVALVTSATDNIGRLVAFAFTQAGADITLCAKNSGPLEIIARELHLRTDAGVLALPFTVDDEEDAADIMSQTYQRFNRLDIAVCCGEIDVSEKFASIANRSDRIETLAGVPEIRTATRASADAMVRHGQGGSIIVTANLMVSPSDSPTDLEAFHTALMQQMLPLAMEYAPFGIRINFIWWKSLKALRPTMGQPNTTHSFRNSIGALLSHSQKGSDEAMALYLFLASEASGHITGVDFMLNNDGRFYSALQRVI